MEFAKFGGFQRPGGCQEGCRAARECRSTQKSLAKQTMPSSLRFAALLWILCLPLFCQVELRADAVVYFGSASNTTAPAAIDEAKVREATPEWKTIQSEGIRSGSARYLLLIAEMDKRIRDAVRAVAGAQSKDLVVRSGDVTNNQGKVVGDLTALVIQRL